MPLIETLRTASGAKAPWVGRVPVVDGEDEKSSGNCPMMESPMMLRPGVRSDELDAEVEPFVPVGFEDELFPEDAPDAGGGGTRVRDDRQTRNWFTAI